MCTTLESTDILIVLYFDSCCFFENFLFWNILKYIFYFLKLIFYIRISKQFKNTRKKSNQEKDENILESGLERKNKPHLNM